MRPLLLSWLVLTASSLAAPAARAQAGGPGSQMFAWTIEGSEDADPRPWMVGLWLPVGGGGGGGEAPTLGDALGRHAAAYPVPTPRCVITLDRLIEDPGKVPALDWQRATLTPAGGTPLVAQEGEVWRGERAGVDRVDPRPGGRDPGLLRARLLFAPLPPGCQRARLEVPVLDDLPLVISFARWEALVAAAERDLTAWRESGQAAAPEAFTRHGERVRAGLLLRELQRGRDGQPALAPAAALAALLETEWGRTQLGTTAPGPQDEAALARAVDRALRQWSALRHPNLPGIEPPAHRRR